MQWTIFYFSPCIRVHCHQHPRRSDTQPLIEGQKECTAFPLRSSIRGFISYAQIMCEDEPPLKSGSAKNHAI